MGSLQEIAREVGVSVATVSLVLSDKADTVGIKEATRQRGWWRRKPFASRRGRGRRRGGNVSDHHGAHGGSGIVIVRVFDPPPAGSVLIVR